MTKATTPSFAHAHTKTFCSTFNFYKLYLHAKNRTILSICSGEIVHLKILQSGWLRACWLISQEPIFFQT